MTPDLWQEIQRQQADKARTIVLTEHAETRYEVFNNEDDGIGVVQRDITAYGVYCPQIGAARLYWHIVTNQRTEYADVRKSGLMDCADMYLASKALNDGIDAVFNLRQDSYKEMALAMRAAEAVQMASLAMGSVEEARRQNLDEKAHEMAHEADEPETKG